MLYVVHWGHSNLSCKVNIFFEKLIILQTICIILQTILENYN